jgi:hypothetical protein
MVEAQNSGICSAFSELFVAENMLVFPGDHLQAFKAMQAAKTLLTQRFCQSAGATFQRRKMHPRSYARIVFS